MNLWTSILAPWRILCLRMLMLLALGASQAAQAQAFLPPDKVFSVSVSAAGPRLVKLDFALANGVYLYRERMKAQLQMAGGVPQSLGMDLPPGQSKHDPTFDKVLEVYHGDVAAAVNLPASAQGEGILTVGYQGCAEAGLCYPPQEKQFKLVWKAAGELATVTPMGAANAAASNVVDGVGAGGLAEADSAPSDQITQALASGHLGSVVLVFFIAGALLSLTPCVLPMVPILSSIIVGQRERVSRGRGFALALSYSQGMALVYTALGVAAGLLGQGLSAYLQHPWVVLGFGALMVLLSLSMFGLYELQLPATLQSWLGAGSNQLPGGRFVSVFAMGVVSALVVSPCVSAPLAGALLYISQTHDVWLGGGALYAMAWGMSMPLLLVGLSAGSLLPRTGPWMKAVKAVFGVLMLLMAVWITRPAWPYVQTQWLGRPVVASAHTSVLPFKAVRSVAELDAALAEAASQGRPVMLDFYADWCTSCIEMEHSTFSDALVQDSLKNAVLLQADVTVNSADDRALLKRFKLFGPPGLIFFDAQGHEQSGAQVVGFQKPQAFLISLKQAGF